MALLACHPRNKVVKSIEETCEKNTYVCLTDQIQYLNVYLQVSAFFENSLLLLSARWCILIFWSWSTKIIQKSFCNVQGIDQYLVRLIWFLQLILLYKILLLNYKINFAHFSRHLSLHSMSTGIIMTKLLTMTRNAHESPSI